MKPILIIFAILASACGATSSEPTALDGGPASCHEGDPCRVLAGDGTDLGQGVCEITLDPSDTSHQVAFCQVN